MNTTTTTPDYTTVAAKRTTDELMLAVRYTDNPAITAAALGELRTRDDYRALVDTDHAEAIAEFAQACIDDPGYRLARTGSDSPAVMFTTTLGELLAGQRHNLNGWSIALIRDELHRRAIGRYHVVAAARIADMIREHQLDSQDVHDIAASVDAGELDYVGAGGEVHAYVLSVTHTVRQSACDLMHYVTVGVLGW